MYQYINLENIKDIAGDEDEFIIEILTGYLETNPANLAELEKAVQQKDKEGIAFHAHKLKGSYKFVGAEGLATLADNIERFCTQEDQMSVIESNLAEIKQISVKVLEELNDVLRNLGTQS
jgi:HPt (histidine-containing phosphotransfer) domain-containing protein